MRLGGDLVLEDVNVVARRLDTARSQILPSLGATRYDFGRASLATIPQGDQSSLQQALLQAPGVAADSFGQIHIRNEHGNIQYRLDGVQLPEGLSVFGQVLSTRFAHSLSVITGALPAQYGFNHAAVVDITTKSGTTDPGGAITMYGGARGVLQPSFEYGGRSGAIDYYITSEYLHTNLGIENPTSSLNAIHDTSNQFRGLAHISGIVDANTRISLTAGAFHGDYQIPNRPGRSPGTGLAVNGAGDFDNAKLNEHQRELSQFAILSLQKHYDAFDVQTSVFTRYSSLYFTPDPLGDLLFSGLAQTAARSSAANGVQSDTSFRVSDTHTLRTRLLAQVERSIAKINSSVLPVDENFAQTSDQPFQIGDGSARTGGRYGVYVQDEWKLIPTLTVNYGVRYDVVDEYAHDRDASPRLNVVWNATSETTLHGGYSRYFTPPPFELVGNTTLAKLLGTSAAPGITQNGIAKAERAHYFDAGVSQVVLPGLTVGVDTYYKLSRNLIDEGQFGSPVLLTAFNYQHGRQQGAELSATYDQGPWSMYGSLAYSRGVGKNIVSSQFNFGADQLAYVSQHYIHLDHDQRFTGSAGTAYTVNADTLSPTRLSADLVVESGLRASTDAVPNGRALPGYYAINLAAVQRVELVKGRPTELRLDVLNLLDLTTYQFLPEAVDDLTVGVMKARF